MKAKDIMTTRIATVCPGHGVRRAAEIMLERRVSGLPVVGEDGRLVGILTQGDLLRRTNLGRRPDSGRGRTERQARDRTGGPIRKVEDVMTRDVITIAEDTSVARMAALMKEYSIKRLPVLRDGQLIGIVSRTDLLRAIVAASPETPPDGDEAIRRNVLARLAEAGNVELARLSIAVTDGVVELCGAVGSESERKWVCAAAESADGVAGVVDRLHISADKRHPGDMKQ